jgi:hypothetical protein
MADDRKSGELVIHPHDFALLPLLDRLFRRLPIVDRGTGDISLTRCISTMFAFEVAHIMEHEHAVSTTLLIFASLTMAAAFGKSTFGFWLQKQQMTYALNLTASDTVTRTITENRDAGKGIEHTP